MRGRGLEQVHVRQLCVCRVCQSFFPGVVPQGQDAAHGNVDVIAAVFLLEPLAQGQQVKQILADLYRPVLGFLVQRSDVYDPRVFIILVEQLMIMRQHLFGKLSRLIEHFLGGSVANQLDDCIKGVIKNGRIF